MNIEEQYSNIYSFFKTTTEPFDFISWDGDILDFVLNEHTIEQYTKQDLIELEIELN